MITKEVVILNETGLHARPAQLWIQSANKFESQIKVRKEDGTEVDGKSIMGLMSLAISNNTKIIIEANGNDEVEAIKALTELIESKFGEE